MEVQSAQDLLARRLGEIHSSSCFLAQHIPSMVSAAGSGDLRKLLNLYLDVVRDNADRIEAALMVVEIPKGDCDLTAVPAMVDGLFDLIERIDEPALIDVAILLSSNEIGAYEAKRFDLLSDLAGMLGKKEATDTLKESGQCLSSVCDQLAKMMRTSSGVSLNN